MGKEERTGEEEREGEELGEASPEVKLKVEIFISALRNEFAAVSVFYC